MKTQKFFIPVEFTQIEIPFWAVKSNCYNFISKIINDFGIEIEDSEEIEEEPVIRILIKDNLKLTQKVWNDFFKFIFNESKEANIKYSKNEF